MPSPYLLDLVSALSSSASSSLCIFDDAFDTGPGPFKFDDISPGGYRHVREVAKVHTVEKVPKGCECQELCFCARLDVLNKRALRLVEEGRRCLQA